MNRIFREGTGIQNSYFHFTVNTDCLIKRDNETVITIKISTEDMTLANFGNMPTGHNP